jgi:hypothetical protein
MGAIGMRVFTILLFAILLVGCGTSNQGLKSEYVFRFVTQADTDDSITFVRVSEDVLISADYNARYKLSVSAPAGDYVLRGTDSSGGRYFAARGHKALTIQYVGATLLGAPKPESHNGGVFLDSEGRPHLYWFWGDEYVSPARVPAPRLSVALSTQIDPERVYARKSREERERTAKAKELAEAERRRVLFATLALARTRDRVQCSGEQQCDRAFALAQAYLLKQADMRIQVATGTLVETYNATSDGQIQMRLLRVPSMGDRWEVVISAHCRDELRDSEEQCAKKLIEVYSGFLPHMQR